nr:hypothetical protein [Tanacetum cinerariifolium]
PIKKPSQLSIANAAMRAKDYAKAIDMYQLAMVESPFLTEQLAFNISIAKTHLDRAAMISSRSEILQTRNLDRADIKNFSYRLIESDRLPMVGIRGHIDVVDEKFIHGWIYDIEA